MTLYQTEEKARLRRELSKEAITLAMQNRWDQAVHVNRNILEVFPTDVEAMNRLGKALTELGQYAEARDAFKKALGVAPHNTIAKRNLERLTLLRDGKARVREEPKPVRPDQFIEATGKAGTTTLVNLASSEKLAKLSAGDPVSLKVRGNALVVESLAGEYAGRLEPKLAARLVKLMEGGNKYTAAITSNNARDVRVIIREVFQHPSQRGRISFPAKEIADFRPYVRGSLMRYDLAEEEDEAAASDGEAGGEGEWVAGKKVKEVLEGKDALGEDEGEGETPLAPRPEADADEEEET
ncbi:MAG: tetratricopeptide repeat protein [Dehalococcoidia bacterium]|nr:tetratricopeptide repeat protein [Dehalococcoidia bacterium]